jgi:uncharacterized phage-like protein YoqJ
VKSKSCCFTGHRPQNLPWGEDEADPRCARLRYRLFEELERSYNAGYRHFLCGMALGGDLIFCETVLLMRDKRHPDIIVEAAIPFEGQSSGWKHMQRERYRRLVASCDIKTVLQKEYTPYCMQRRNKYMVDRSSKLIAVYSGSSGRSGTLSTLLYAQRGGLETVVIDPDRL